jgi:hypothetical protein
MTTKFRLTAVAALASAAMIGLTGAAIAAGGHDHERGAETHELTLNHGKKWATDEPLRRGMSEIRALLAAQDEAIHKGRLKPADYAALGAKIEGEVGAIVANCKLEPAADANLHLILEDVIEGADAMQGKAKGKTPRQGAGKVVTALNEYGRHFDHPGWKRF